MFCIQVSDYKWNQLQKLGIKVLCSSESNCLKVLYKCFFLSFLFIPSFFISVCSSLLSTFPLSLFFLPSSLLYLPSFLPTYSCLPSFLPSFISFSPLSLLTFFMIPPTNYFNSKGDAVVDPHSFSVPCLILSSTLCSPGDSIGFIRFSSFLLPPKNMSVGRLAKPNFPCLWMSVCTGAPIRSVFPSTPSVPRIGFRSSLTLTRINQFPKMKESFN